jgi:hypothetical protein
MNRILNLILCVFLLTACDCPYGEEYCMNCGKPIRHCTCYYYAQSNSDRFTAKTLIGVWQMAYDEGYFNGMGIIPKQIEFFDGHTCDITYCKGKDPDWFTDTYTYTYTSGYIKFNKGRTTYMFKYREFLFPTLTVQDSFGTYEWY